MQQQPIVAADVLEALLLALGTADTAVIGQAEADLRRALTKPAFIGDLLDRLQRSPNAQVRQLAAVLMRRKVGGHWSKLPPPVQAQLKASLLTHLAAEPERLVRRATAGVAAVVAKHTLPKGEWAELLAFVTACAADAADAGKRELAMVLLQSLLESEVVVECAARAIHRNSYRNSFGARGRARTAPRASILPRLLSSAGRCARTTPRFSSSSSPPSPSIGGTSGRSNNTSASSESVDAHDPTAASAARATGPRCSARAVRRSC